MELTDEDWKSYDNYMKDYYNFRERFKNSRKLKIQKTWDL